MKVGIKRGIIIGISIIAIIVLTVITTLIGYFAKFMFNAIPKIFYVINSLISFSQTVPEEPKFKYGEFPFELVYEIDGEIITVNDVYVCEYDGISADTGRGKYRKWEGYIKGTGKDAVFICGDNERKVYCFVGDAEFYMNDERYEEPRPLTPRVYAVNNDSANYDIAFFNSTEELMEYYKIRIISWKLSEPIENSFE